VFVVLDTVRRDATGVDGPATPAALSGDAATPNLNRLAAEGVTFTGAWSAAPWTAPSHASMFTGMMPSQHMCLMIRPGLDAHIPTAAAQLTEAGYATTAFFSNPWLSDKSTRLLRGFENKVLSDIGGLGAMTSSEGDQGGALSLRNIRSWFETRDDDRPFLLFVNFLEAHLSYDPPAEYRDAHLADLSADDLVDIDWGFEVNAGAVDGEAIDWNHVTRLYAGDVWFADRMLGDLMAILEEQGVDDQTIVVVTSDHGENLGEHGLIEHQFSVNEAVLGVPLVVRVPEGMAREEWAGILGAGVERTDPVVTTDLYATLLDLAGLEEAVDAAPWSSVSLLDVPTGRERYAVAEYGGPSKALLGKLEKVNPEFDRERLARSLQTVRLGDLRLTIDNVPTYELHDIAADPRQERNLASQRPDDLRRLMNILSAVQDAQRRDAQPVQQMDEETRRRLESLGYVN
jgi:arylsulfatase A-like enzyme